MEVSVVTFCNLYALPLQKLHSCIVIFFAELPSHRHFDQRESCIWLLCTCSGTLLSLEKYIKNVKMFINFTYLNHKYIVPCVKESYS
jgi:hypothetical protein